MAQEEIARPPDMHKPAADRRTIFLIIAAFILGFIVFFISDNYETIIAGQVKGGGWERIDSRIVEQSCLAQAKKVAVSEGYSEAVVLSCSCVYVQSDILKTFDCDVNTIDITHPARKILIHCYKISDSCTVASDRGLETRSITELEQVIG